MVIAVELWSTWYGRSLARVRRTSWLRATRHLINASRALDFISTAWTGHERPLIYVNENICPHFRSHSPHFLEPISPFSSLPSISLSLFRFRLKSYIIPQTLCIVDLWHGTYIPGPRSLYGRVGKFRPTFKSGSEKRRISVILLMTSCQHMISQNLN